MIEDFGEQVDKGMDRAFWDLIKKKAQEKILFLPHAVRQMNRPERMITVEEIQKVILEGEIIEDYPGDRRGHSCLILGLGNRGRPIHVVCAPKDEYLAIITAYVPNEEEWEKDFKTRKKK